MSLAGNIAHLGYISAKFHALGPPSAYFNWLKSMLTSSSFRPFLSTTNSTAPSVASLLIVSLDSVSRFIIQLEVAHVAFSQVSEWDGPKLQCVYFHFYFYVALTVFIHKCCTIFLISVRNVFIEILEMSNRLQTNVELSVYSLRFFLSQNATWLWQFRL